MGNDKKTVVRGHRENKPKSLISCYLLSNTFFITERNGKKLQVFNCIKKNPKKIYVVT